MYNVGIYIRLSKEDINNTDESQSIKNQRELIMTYLKKNNLKLLKEYVDDGYSGTTFNRPGFNDLISDIERNIIDMVITKDLSRLGRDYIKSGYYLEQYFPLKGVRYVSILDNIDTSIDSTNNDIAPFRALFNDMQSKDTSKKIRSILRNKKEQGLFLGSSASYGYKKDKYDKHKLVIDKYASRVVRKIFLLATNGKSNKEICELLNHNKIKTPYEYKNKTNYGFTWSQSTISNILSNIMYTGTMIQGRQSKLSYKSNKRIKLDENQWIIVNNTHKPIISIEVFNTVNKKIRNNTKRERLLLEGLIYCNECNSKMGIRIDKRNKDNIHHSINCNNHVNKKKCVSHFMIYEALEREIIHLLERKLNINSNNDIKLTRKNHNIKLIELYDEKYDNNQHEIKMENENILTGIITSINRSIIEKLISKITVSKKKEIKIYYRF